MNEELIDMQTEDSFQIDEEAIVEIEIEPEDIEQNVDIDETVETIEVETVEEINIEIEEAVGWVGGNNTSHYSLYGRDERDQHPIVAITGLREELDEIKSLDVVYSDERNQANYYLWEDENVLQENRVGYFVSACEDINKIRFCTDDSDIFGVTVDGAGFIGAQSEVTRDIKYGLVVVSGIVHVRCEMPVSVGDYVISNDYGYAKVNKTGYKVVGRHNINGIEYAEIILVTPIERICEISDDVDNLSDRMDDAETNIVAAMNVANAAYNKAGEAEGVSEDAILKALEALKISGETSSSVDRLYQDTSNAKELAAQAKAISESAAVSAENIHKEAVATANNALSEAYKTQDDLGELIDEMTPLTQWEGENGSGIVGFVARANADSATLASLAEWSEEGDVQSIAGTIAKVNEHEAVLDHITSHQGVNSSTIAQVEQKADDNGASITSLVSSVDKYSVGEYSQAYGLTREQAASILKPGYIYIPTKHKDSQSHSETFVDETEPQWFTPEDYYVWGINDQGETDWIEHSVGSVWISNAIPANANDKYKYWYIDSNMPPTNYEAYALYMWEDSQWKKVNTLAGNASNRAVSMIRQKTNEIAAEVTNTRGDLAALSLTVDDNRNTQAALIAKVVNDDGTVNTASIISAVTDGKSSTAITADHIVLNGYTSNANGSFQIDQDGYMIASGGQIGGWSLTSDKLTKSTDKFQVDIKAPTAFYDGTNTTSSTSTVMAIKDVAQNSWPFIVRSDGSLYATKVNISGTINATNGSFSGTITATDGTIGSWRISKDDGYLQGYTDANNYVNIWAPNSKNDNFINVKYNGDYKFRVTSTGEVHAMAGTIGGWTIGINTLYSASGNNGVYINVPNGVGETSDHDVIAIKADGSWPFILYSNGKVVANKAKITGDITADSGNFANGVTIGGTSITAGDLRQLCRAAKGYTSDALQIQRIEATGGTVGGWTIGERSIGTENEYISIKIQGQPTMYQYTQLMNTKLTSYAYDDSSGSGTSRIGGSVFWSIVASNAETSSVVLTAESDANIKNSISPYTMEYDELFNNLQPCRYKYNNGTSNRYHTGFIAQEVVAAINESGLTTQDFAGVIHLDEPNCNGAEWLLRRDEFVALNTWQIQKAKARITELENRVAELEKLIKE